MSKIILKNGKFRKFLKKDYDEVFLFFKKFAINSDLLLLKSNSNHLSIREKNRKMKEIFDEAVRIDVEKYLLIDLDTEKIVAFYSFGMKSKFVEWIFVNPEYYFTEKIANSANTFFQMIGTKYNKSKLVIRLFKRSNFTRYVKFVCRHYNAKVVAEKEDFTIVESNI